MNKNKEDVKYDGLPMEHEFDGIKELNNPPPPWLLYLFYISVVFSVIYIVYYHYTDYGELQDQEYLSEMADAEVVLQKIKANTKQLEIVLLTDEESLINGKEFFDNKTCIACHGAVGQGNAIGPNLTDEFWIHGSSIEDVFNIIKVGNPTKGMTPFKDILTDKQILEVSSYILDRLVGSNPENAKEPQGEKTN